jgi:hypothetical protein
MFVLILQIFCFNFTGEIYNTLKINVEKSYFFRKIGNIVQCLCRFQ